MFFRIKPNKIKQEMDDISKRIPTAVAIGVNSTAKKARNEAAKAIRKELGSRVPLKAIKSAARATSVATKDKQTAVMTLAAGRPISLRYFNPSQTKKQGVTVRFNRNIKGPQGRTHIPNAFLSKRLGKKVFVRAGKERLPIVEQFGPSPGDFIEALGLERSSVVLIKKELPKRINRKIRDLFYMKKIGKK
jgi:hypothetical protein